VLTLAILIMLPPLSCSCMIRLATWLKLSGAMRFSLMIASEKRGEAVAASRGVNVDVVIWGSFALVGVLTATIVANCGPIGFVGLMIPHVARAFVEQVLDWIRKRMAARSH